MAPKRSAASRLKPKDPEPAAEEVSTEFPRVMYNQKNGQTRTVKNQEALEKLDAEVWADAPHEDFPPQSHGHIEGAPAPHLRSK